MKSASRSGKTLIEMVLIVTVMGMVTTISATVMNSVMKAEGHSRDTLVATTAHSDLSVRFRHDAHAASSANLVKEDDRVTGVDLKQPSGETIHYRIEDGSFLRTIEADGSIVGRESYAVNFESASFETFASEIPQVVLIYSKPYRKSQEETPQRTYRVLAAIGKDLRFEGGTP
ncbi:MAG: hypothetical protein HUJ26_03450 [Planctomycetaceae bacterium]|nr:hypothetical protein [Planctomycetaceae bacterium]